MTSASSLGLDTVPSMSNAMTIMLVCGSVRAGSTNAALLHTAAAIAATLDLETDVYEGVGTLPHFNPDDDRDPLPPSVADLRDRIDRADALLLCTPEYAGDLPGSFKNLLDWTVGGMETVDKPAAWINVSTSGSRAEGAHRALRTVLTYTGAIVVDDACRHVPVRRDAVGPDGLVADAEVRAMVGGALRALSEHVRATST